MRIDPLIQDNSKILEHFMYMALFVRPGQASFPYDTIFKPDFKIYFDEWGSKADDKCLILSNDAKEIGAIWIRCFTKEELSHGYVADNIPELTISIEEEFRFQGWGTRLLQSMINSCQSDGYNGMSLSVDKENPVSRLYTELGFRIHSEQHTANTMFLKF